MIILQLKRLETKQNFAGLKHLQNSSIFFFILLASPTGRDTATALLRLQLIFWQKLQYNREVFGNILREIQFSNDWFWSKFKALCILDLLTTVLLQWEQRVWFVTWIRKIYFYHTKCIQCKYFMKYKNKPRQESQATAISVCWSQFSN